MENNRVKLITIIQKWSSGKLPIGTKFELEGTDKVIVLTSCEGYPNGNFIFENGEEFEIGKYFNCFFNQLEITLTETKPETIYIEDVWDEYDVVLNPNETSKNELIIRNAERKDLIESFKDINYFDVTDLIIRVEEIEAREKKKGTPLTKYDIYDFLKQKEYFTLTNEKLMLLFLHCTYEVIDKNETEGYEVLRVKMKEHELGIMIKENIFSHYYKYSFAPNKELFGLEYFYESYQPTGYFITGDNYFDTAISSMERYGSNFAPLLTTNPEKNEASYGYQADTLIKTLFAFSCESYLKSLLLLKGLEHSELKKIGHGLSELFTELDDDTIAEVYQIMVNEEDYDINESDDSKYYDSPSLEEKFMLDLAKYAYSFVDARYSAENAKDTNYDFLKKFALSLRKVIKLKYNMESPYDYMIEDSTSPEL